MRKPKMAARRIRAAARSSRSKSRKWRAWSASVCRERCIGKNSDSFVTLGTVACQARRSLLVPPSPTCAGSRGPGGVSEPRARHDVCPTDAVGVIVMRDAGQAHVSRRPPGRRCAVPGSERETTRSSRRRPYRVDVDGSVEVLLVTSRETKRWIIPKGWPIKGLKAAKAAAREAFEEAGVQGRVTRRALGRYLYEKRLEDRRATVPCDVQVFPLAVRRQLKNWPEANQRTAQWFSAAKAAALVTDDGLSPLILQLEQQKRAPRRKSKGARRE